MNAQKYAQKYPQLISCVKDVQALVQILREHPEYELEARFGKKTSRKFIPGVDRETVDVMIGLLENCSSIDADEEWREVQDVIFSHKGKRLRTRVEYNSDEMVLKTTTIEKLLIDQKDFLNVGNMDPNEKLDIRVSLKNEAFVKDIPLSVSPDLVRIKQIRQFRYKSFSFDFSMTWSGSTRKEAEMSQTKDEATFEIECELVNSKEYLSLHDDMYIALSLLLKMYDFMSDESSLIPYDGRKIDEETSSCQEFETL